MPPNDSWMACCFRTTLARILRSEVTIAAHVSSGVLACQRQPSMRMRSREEERTCRAFQAEDDEWSRGGKDSACGWSYVRC